MNTNLKIPGLILLPPRSDIKNYDDLYVADNDKNGRIYSKQWEWFDPFELTSFDDVDLLPAYWAHLITHMNRECWECKYRWIHIPNLIYAQYPSSHPTRGIFAVTSLEVNHENFKAGNLIHLADEFMDELAEPNFSAAEYFLSVNKRHKEFWLGNKNQD